MVTFSYGDSDFGPRAPRFHGAEQEAEADGMAGGVGRGRRRGGRRRGKGAGDIRGAGGPGGAWQPPADGRQARAAPGEREAANRAWAGDGDAGGRGRGREREEGEPVAGRNLGAPRPEPPDAEAVRNNGFAALGLPLPLMQAVVAAGFQEPTPIQREAIGPALLGRDLFGQAQTGTGKTAAFVLPTLARIVEGGGPQALIVTPTRELALQIETEIHRLAAFTRFQTVCLVGGHSYGPQRHLLARGAELVVGTPGRLLDLARSGDFDAGRIDILILDEGDRLYDLGFQEELEAILRLTRNRRQMLLFSATIPAPVVRLAGRHLREPVTCNVMPRTATVENVRQSYFTVDDENKFPLLLRVLERESIEQAIIFTRTKKKCSAIGERLLARGVDAAQIHGDLLQRKRENILKRFRDGKLQVLVATDVAARGLDIPAVSHIINYDIPEYAEDYVHRVGRTARMGRPGRAISFVTPEGGRFLTDIEKLINVQVERDQIAGFAPTGATAEAAPVGEAPAAAARRQITFRRPFHRRVGRRR